MILWNYADTDKLYIPFLNQVQGMLKDESVDVELNIGEGMNHVYLIYPLVPESKDVFNQIVNVILNQDWFRQKIIRKSLK